MNKKYIALLLVLVVALVGVPEALARSAYLGTFESKYPSVVGTRLDTCDTCHTPALFTIPGASRLVNYYGRDFFNSNHDFTAIEGIDSDGDTFTNIVEINALTFPGDPNDFPSATVTPTFNVSGFKINNDTGMGISGWTITLTNGTITVPTTTNNEGMYQFTGLANGTYTVTETVQSGWTNVTPISVDVLIDGANVANQNFTNQPIPTPAATLTFVATDSISGLPIAGATVSAGKFRGKTDTTGTVSFTVTPGDYRYTVRAGGYVRTTDIVSVTGDITVNVALVPR